RVDDQRREVLDALREEICRVARIDRLEVLDDGADPSGSARLVVQGAEVMIPLAGVLDVESECARIRKRLEEVARDAERAARKLDNRGFTDQAPSEVVEKERRKLVAVEEERAVLEAQLVELGC
ncbi:MAG TPA: valine--tRNA ligase, partial [Actinomycetota bacterium]|nr:valine--tRNA ligase [Actinomycetota bacterium]